MQLLKLSFYVAIALLGLLLVMAGIATASGSQVGVLIGMVVLVLYAILWFVGSHLKFF